MTRSGCEPFRGPDEDVQVAERTAVAAYFSAAPFCGRTMNESQYSRPWHRHQGLLSTSKSADSSLYRFISHVLGRAEPGMSSV